MDFRRLHTGFCEKHILDKLLQLNILVMVEVEGAVIE